MSSQSAEAHITEQTGLLPALGAWEIYLNDQGRSPYTVKSFLNDLNLLANYMPPGRTVGSITTRELNNFLGWLQNGRGVPCSPKSLSRRITAIKAFDPADKVLQQSVISPLPEVLTEEEERKVLETADAYRRGKKQDARPYALLSLLLITGIKKGECLNIHINHVDLEAPGGPILFVRYANPQNRYKERKIELPGDWVTAYKEYLEQYQPRETVFPWSPRRLEYLLEEIGQKAGLTKHLSFDMCRWTSALDDWLSGAEHDTIRQKLGISKIQWREVGNKLRQLAGEKS